MNKKARYRLLQTAAIIAVLASLALAVPVGVAILFPDSFTIRSIIFYHLCASVLFTFGFFILTDDRSVKSRYSREKRGNVWWIFVFVLSVSLPLYGIITSLLIYIVQRIKKTLPPPIVSDEITVQDPEIFRKLTNLPRQLAVLDRLDIEPFVDIFRSGTQELKKSAVKLLGNMRSKKSIRTLMMALMDPDIEIRLFAAGILSRIEDEYAIDIKNKSLQYKKSRHNLKQGMDLVGIYLSYAEIGLLDTIARTYYYNQAIGVLNELPDNPEICHKKAHIYYELGNLDEAEKYTKLCLKDHGDDPEATRLLCNIEFRRARYDDLRKSIMNAEKSALSGLPEGVIRYWTVQ